MKKRNRFPPGWNNARVQRQRVLSHYQTQSDIEAVAEDEAAYRSTTTTVMKIPVKLVPAVRALLARRRASWSTEQPGRVTVRGSLGDDMPTGALASVKRQAGLKVPKS